MSCSRRNSGVAGRTQPAGFVAVANALKRSMPAGTSRCSACGRSPGSGRVCAPRGCKGYRVRGICRYVTVWVLERQSVGAKAAAEKLLKRIRYFPSLVPRCQTSTAYAKILLQIRACPDAQTLSWRSVLVSGYAPRNGVLAIVRMLCPNPRVTTPANVTLPRAVRSR